MLCFLRQNEMLQVQFILIHMMTRYTCYYLLLEFQSRTCSAILTVPSYVQKFWGDFDLLSWILCFACHAADRFGPGTDYLTSSQSHIWSVLSLVSSCYMNRIPKLTLIYPLSSSTRELHEAKAASVKEKVFHTGISQIGRSFIHKYVKSRGYELFFCYSI